MRTNRCLRTVVCGMVLWLVGVWGGPVWAAPIRLTYSNFFPPTHFNSKLGESWAREIETRTDGRIKIPYFPGGTLLKPAETFDGVLKGIADIGMSCFAYNRGRFSTMEALDLPIGYPSGMVATRIANDFVKTFNPEELSEVKVLYLHAHGPGLLHSKKPVRTLADMKGLKVRATGFSSKVVGALDASAVGMPQSGAYEALQKGVVEATFSPIEVLKGWRQAEVIRFTTDCHVVGYTTAMYIIINRDKWNALPPDIQRIFEEVSAGWIPMHAEGWDAADAEGREYSLSLGNEIITLPEEENTRWSEAVSPIIEDYIKKAESKGLPGRAYVDFIREAIAERQSGS